MLIPLAISLHLLAAVIWVGGMFFAYVALRPVAAEILEPPFRLELWTKTFSRFFMWVWVCVIILPISGYWMIMQNWGNLQTVGVDLKLMHIIGWVMILIFMFVFFLPYRRMKRAMAQSDIKTAADSLALIRKLVAINLALGIVVNVIASAGRYM